MPVDLTSALDLRTNHGLSYTEIAKLQGVSKQAIHQQLSKIIPEPSLIEQFKERKSDLIQYAQLKALETYLNLDPEEQKEMLLRRGLVDMGIAFDKGQLMDGLATSNVAIVHSDIKALGELQRQRRGGHRS